MHPLLGHCTRSEPERIVFEAIYNAARLWPLAEHIVAGTPVLPGTAYIEIARAALAHTDSGKGVVLENVAFLAPLTVAFATRRAIRTTLTRTDDRLTTIEVASTAEGMDEAVVHFRASAVVQAPLPAAVLADWPGGEKVKQDALVAQAGVVEFGPRWQSLTEVSVSSNSARATLSLGERWVDDLATWQAHPALLDMAATIGLHLLDSEIRAQHIYVPASIDRVTCLQTLPQNLVVQAQLVDHEEGHSARFDVVIADEMGRPVMTLTGFTMRAISRAGFGADASDPDEANSIVGRLLGAGIRVVEGPDVIAHALSHMGPRLVVSSIALDALDKLYRERLGPGPRGAKGAGGETGKTLTRARMSPSEAKVAELFSELLGIDDVDLDDEFLALGGHSLAAVRLFAAIRRQLGVDLGIATLFTAPSVRALAAQIDEQRGDSPLPTDETGRAKDATGGAAAPATTQARKRETAASRTIKRRWQPLVRIAKGKPGHPAVYWIHGAMGNVVSIKPLADQIGQTYPVFGLQAQGIDGRLPPLEKVEDMAMSYVAAIREIDPDGPYCLLGYSGGGVIGYEMARQFAMDGQSVPLLAMIDTLAPTHAQSASIADWLRFAYREGLDRFTEQVKNSWSLRLYQFTRRFNTQPGDAQSVDKLIANSELVFDAYVRAQSHYYTLPYDGDILLFRAKRGGIPFQLAGPTLGWDDHVGRRVEVVEIDGTHESVIEPPAVHGIGDKLREKLEALAKPGIVAGDQGSPAFAMPTMLAAK